MKKLMLLASGLLIAFCNAKLYAQASAGVLNTAVAENANEYYTDTIIVRLSDNNQLMILDNSLKAMSRYAHADSIKTLFMSDWERALAEKSISPDATLVHYFVHSSGKRRMKAENPEYTDNKVDPAYELKRMDLDLPKHRFIIHDVSSGYRMSTFRMEIYCNDPSRLKDELAAVDLNKAIARVRGEKKIMCRNNKIAVSKENNEYQVTASSRTKKLDAIEAVPSFGMGIIGNTVAPVAGVDLSLRLGDKYGVSSFKISLGFSAFPFLNTIGHEVTGVSFVRSYDLRFAHNVSSGTRRKPYWLGLQGGIMNSEIHSFNKAYKVGVLYEGAGPFNYSFDYIRDRNHNPIYGITVKLPF